MEDRFRCILWLGSWSAEYLESGVDRISEGGEGRFGSERLFSIGRSGREDFGEDVGPSRVFAKDWGRFRCSERDSCVLIGMLVSRCLGVGFGWGNVMIDEDLELETRYQLVCTECYPQLSTLGVGPAREFSSTYGWNCETSGQGSTHPHHSRNAYLLDRWGLGGRIHKRLYLHT